MYYVNELSKRQVAKTDRKKDSYPSQNVLEKLIAKILIFTRYQKKKENFKKCFANIFDNFEQRDVKEVSHKEYFYTTGHNFPEKRYLH